MSDLQEVVTEEAVVEEPVVEAAAEEASEEICPDCGKPAAAGECECATEEEEEKVEDKVEQDDVNENQEYVELSEKYSALQNDFAAAQETINSLNETLNGFNEEITALRTFKNGVEKKQKEEMIDSFYMLSEEDKKDVTANIDKYSLEDIEAKLSILCVRNKVNFNLDDENNDKGPTTYNLSNLDDMDDDAGMPAWVKAALATANKN